MKPTKNRIYCVGCSKPKILFESRKKALNFIKFNASEIQEENGISPKRAYHCIYCGGWHVTSTTIPVSERGIVRKSINRANKLMGEQKWGAAARCLCYARDQLCLVQEKLLPSYIDDCLDKDIQKTKKILDNTYTNFQKRKSISTQIQIHIYTDLNYNICELDVSNVSHDAEYGGKIFEITPKLLTQYDGKYYYVICNCRLSKEELQITKKINVIPEEDDSIQSFSYHHLNIVQVKRIFDENNKHQYEDVSDLFEGDILGAWISGMKLRVVEKTVRSTKCRYKKRSEYDYWIKLGNRNVHFYIGRQFKYTCIVSATPINTQNTLRIFKKNI